MARPPEFVLLDKIRLLRHDFSNPKDNGSSIPLALTKMLKKYKKPNLNPKRHKTNLHIQR